MAVSKVILNNTTLMDVTDDTVESSKLLSGITATQSDGVEISGSIASLGATTYNTSTSDQTIASGKYISGTQTIKAVTTANIDAGNIKKGVVVKVGDANSATRIKNVTGTFTTTPSGKSAITATTVRSGYSGFINGAQVDGTMPDATFANSATSGKTYTDISSTAPVLVEGDYLYINEGYTPYSKISLAHLVPDGSDVKGHAEYILSGHSAYDNDGTLVAGSVPALTASDISVSGATVTIPVGKHTGESGATAVTKTIGSGTVSTTFTGDGMSTYFNSGTSSDKNVTITPKYTNTAGYVAAHSTATNNGGTTYYKIKTVSGSIGGSASGGSATAAISNVNSMNTITDISGKTAGTDYWTVKATATGGAGSYTPKYTVSTAGWIASTVTGTAQTVSVSSDSTGKSIYIPKAVIAGSSTNATATTTVAPGTVSVAKQDVPSGVTQAASGSATTTAPSSGVYVAVKATAAANSTGTTSSISGSGSATVSTAGYAPTTLTGTVSVSGTATAKTSAKDSSVTYVPITTATPTFSSPTPTGGSTATGTNVTLSTTNNGMLVQTKYSVNQATVTYSAAVNGWVSKASGAEAVKTTARSSTNGTAYYVTGVTMPKDKGFTVTTTADTALDTTSDLDVTNNAYRRVDVVNKDNATTIVTNGEALSPSWTTGKYLTTNGAVGATVNITSFTTDSSWKCAIITCAPDDVFFIKGTGGITPRLWCFCDSSNKILSNAATSASLTYGAITAPASTAKLIINTNSGDSFVITKKSGAVSVASNRGGVAITSAGLGYGRIYVQAYDTATATELTSKTVVDAGIWSTTTVSASGTYYGRVVVGAGTITNNTSGGTSSGTINRGSQIKIGKGYYASDAYYTAQANSGTVTLTASGNTSCNGYATVNAPAATPAFDGGTLSGGSTATGTNVTLSTTDNGMKVQTAYTASSTAVLYNGAVNGWVTVADNAQALAAQSKSSTNGTAYYVTAVTMPKDKGFTVTTTADTALDTSSDLDVTNNAYRRVDITNKANGTVLVANSGTSTITSGSATAGTLTVNAYNNASTPALTGAQNVVTSGKWVINDVTTSGTYYGMTVVPSTMIVPSGNIQLTTSSSTDVSAYATATVRGVTAAISGGGLSGTATASGSGCSISDSTNNSGVSITTACTATRAKVSCTASTAGWASGTIKELAQGTGAMTAKTYYVNGVTISKPSSGTRTFSVTVPNGASTATFVFNVDTSGNVTITES